MKYIFDLDDQSDQYDVLPRLLELKEILPNLKVNLFTIPDATSPELIAEMRKHPWIQIIPHGFTHSSNYEFSKLSYREAADLFTKTKLKCFEFVKGFKAPGWQISTEVMQALKDRGWWVAVQYSDGRFDGDVNGPYQPKVIPGLNFYALNELLPGYKAIHGHTWDCCGNGLEQLWPELIKLPQEAEFEFIDTYVKNLPSRQ